MEMYKLPEFSPIVMFLDSLLSELNVGLMIYHLGEKGKPETLKLIYANREAERSTGIDMPARVGKHILEAFPPLEQTDIPQTFHDVTVNGAACRLDLPYAQPGEKPVDYSVRAFPMPADCVGVLFERTDQK